MVIRDTEVMFSVKSKLVADVSKQFANKRRKTLVVDEAQNEVSGNFYCDEYDESCMEWAPSKAIPKGKKVVEWLVDVMTNGGLLTKKGIEHISKNIEETEKSIESYYIMSRKCQPYDYGDNYILFEEYDGSEVKVTGFDSSDWDDVWREKNRQRVNEIFSKHNEDIEIYEPSNRLIGEAFRDCYDAPFFLELMDEFGKHDKLEFNPERKKVSKDEVEKEIKVLIEEFEKSSKSPDEIDFNGLTVSIPVFPDLKCAQDVYCKNKIAFFMRSCIMQMGGKANKSRGSSMTDAIVLINDFNQYHISGLRVLEFYGIEEFYFSTEETINRCLSEEEVQLAELALYKSDLEMYKEFIIEANKKRTDRKKPKKEIIILWEDELFRFLENKEKDDVFHENRKKITEELIGEDCKFLDDETIKKYYDAEIPGRYIAL